MSEDLAPANPLDLAGRTLMFTPGGGGGYSREVRALDWEEDLGDPVDDNAEIVFQFDFAGREWDSFFVSRYGLVTFGEPYPFSQVGPDRWGTMAEIAQHLGAPPAIAALYKPRLGGWSTYDADQFRNTQHVSRRPDQVVVTWITTDPAFHVHGVPPQEKTRFQMTLHADGGIAFHYAPEPDDPDEIRDGIVGLFPGAVKTGLLGSIPDPVDASVPAHLDHRALRDRRDRYRVGRVPHPSDPKSGDLLHSGDRRLGFFRWSRPAAGRQPNGRVGRRSSVRPRCR